MDGGRVRNSSVMVGQFGVPARRERRQIKTRGEHGRQIKIWAIRALPADLGVDEASISVMEVACPDEVWPPCKWSH